MLITSTYQRAAGNSSSLVQTSANTSTGSVSVLNNVTDDGAGHFFGSLGIVGYAAKTVTLKVVSDYAESSFQSNSENIASWESLNATGSTFDDNSSSTGTGDGGGGSSSSKGGNYGTTSQKEVFGSSGLVARYKTGSPTPTAASESFAGTSR